MGMQQAQAPRERVVPRVDEGKLRFLLGLRPRAEAERLAAKRLQLRVRNRMDRAREREHVDYLDRGESL